MKEVDEDVGELNNVEEVRELGGAHSCSSCADLEVRAYWEDAPGGLVLWIALL